jgi:hypothetical protein
MSEQTRLGGKKPFGEKIDFEMAKQVILDSEAFGSERASFLDVFEEEIDPENRTTVYYNAQWGPIWSAQGFYLIGNSKVSPETRVTLEAVDTYFNLTGGNLQIQLGLDHETMPVHLLTPEEFQRVRTEKEESISLYIEAFPLYAKEHGGLIAAKGLAERTQYGAQLTGKVAEIEKKVADDRLDEIVTRMYDSLISRI